MPAISICSTSALAKASPAALEARRAVLANTDYRKLIRCAKWRAYRRLTTGHSGI